MKQKFRHNFLKKIRFLIPAFSLLNPVHASCNPRDTLELNVAVERVLQQYPTVNLALEALSAADAKIGLARSGYLPNIDVSASYTRIGPVPSFDFPDFGHIQLYPENNYAANLNVQQTIYDFGKTSKRITVEKETKLISEEGVETVKQQLTRRVISLYYTILYIQEAIRIKDQQIDDLEKHLSVIEKKLETGSATDYEVLSTRVKLIASQTQKTDLETALSIQSAGLNSLLGQPEQTILIPSPVIFMPVPQEIQDSSIARALKNRSEIKMAVAHEKLMETRIELAKAENNPVILAFVSAGEKNGYVPDIGRIRTNYSAGIGLKIPLYDAARTRYSISLARSSLSGSRYEKDILVKDITNEVVENYQKEIASMRKLEQSDSQVQQALRAFELANRSYDAGAITNLDLLDAATSLSESRLMQLKARIDMLIGYYGLRLAEGQKLFPAQ
jgi:outer membrane protein TolC